MLTCITFATCISPLAAQWEIQDAHTTANLRGIHYVGNGVAWASGSEGTVLRTEDMGFVWQLCAVPPGAEKLDFRGVQAFDSNTAIVMSSGKGDLSRLYKTTDGCQTWKLLFTNPDSDGFWDAVAADSEGDIALLGDPVKGRFVVRTSEDAGKTWRIEETAPSFPGEAAFAASNSSLLAVLADSTCQTVNLFVTGGPQGARIFVSSYKGKSCKPSYNGGPISFFQKGEGAGIFSIAAGNGCYVFVGGSYQKPDDRDGTAGFQCPLPDGYKESVTKPGGYRSSVAWDRRKTWITVGPNGTDISTDDGRNWHPLKPGPVDAPDADQHWNALSLPFVVGPKGRIGLLHTERLGAQRTAH